MRNFFFIFLFILAILIIFLGLDAGSEIVLQQNLQAPNRAHWFGTNHLGQDVFIQVSVGLINSLAFALVVRGITVAIGLLIGAISGYFGGWLDMLVMRVVDVFLAFPDLLLAIGFSVAFGKTTRFSLGLVLILVSWPTTARIVRSKVLTIKSQTYIDAAVALGGTSGHILASHVLLECLSLTRYLFFIGFGSTIMAESSLSFLGLGVSSLPTLGILIQEGYPYLLSAPWIGLFPAAILSLVILITLEKSIT